MIEPAPVLTEKASRSLPFENLSAEANNAFLANGIQDALRSNPRFQKILAGPEPKTVY
jgi:hypothetical protein